MSNQPNRNFPQSCAQGLYWMPFFHPIPLLLIETQLPMLKFTLKHLALSCFEHAVHLLPDIHDGILETSMLILFPKLKSPCLTAMVLSPFPQLSSNPTPSMGVWKQIKTSHFYIPASHLNCTISTVSPEESVL